MQRLLARLRSWLCATCCFRKPEPGSVRFDDINNLAEEPKVYSWDKRPKVDPKEIMFDRLEDAVEAKLSGQINGQQFIIQNCKNSSLLVLDHTASVTVDDCIGCTILIGPCKGSIFIRDCVDCNLILICQQFRTRDCRNMNCLLHCATQPIIESSSEIHFGCLQISYPSLQDNYDQSGVSIFNNLWSKIHDFTPSEAPKNFAFLSEDISLADYVKADIRQQYGVVTTPSITPLTLGSRRKPIVTGNDGEKCAELAFLLFFNPGIVAADQTLKSFCRQFLEHIQNLDAMRLVQCKEIQMQSSDIERIIETKIFNEAVTVGPVVSFELYGIGVHQRSLDVINNLAIPRKLVYLAQPEKAASQSANFYNFYDMQMGI